MNTEATFIPYTDEHLDLVFGTWDREQNGEKVELGMGGEMLKPYTAHFLAKSSYHYLLTQLESVKNDTVKNPDLTAEAKQRIIGEKFMKIASAQEKAVTDATAGALKATENMIQSINQDLEKEFVGAQDTNEAILFGQIREKLLTINHPEKIKHVLLKEIEKGDTTTARAALAAPNYLFEFSPEQREEVRGKLLEKADPLKMGYLASHIAAQEKVKLASRQFYQHLNEMKRRLGLTGVLKQVTCPQYYYHSI